MHSKNKRRYVTLKMAKIELKCSRSVDANFTHQKIDKVGILTDLASLQKLALKSNHVQVTFVRKYATLLQLREEK